ncbi:MAG: permease-like cell division protein FtsX [gamma proteobacterium symbiont of Bathyaustriella thionipta]|nr:permease-like cell division protein FtsX [gamma proteobacterium symbiont of Bathyaustriella thionipta]
MKKLKASRRIGGKHRWNANKLLLHHLHAAIFSLGRLSRNALSSLLTLAVIGIAIALPAGLYLLLNYASHSVSNWDENSAAISVFLRQEIDLPTAQALQQKLLQRADINSIHIIDKDSAMQEFRQFSGFAGALDALDSNPLPHLLIIQPTLNEDSSTQDLQQLEQALRTQPEVDLVQIDTAWLQRFQAISNIGQRAILVLGSLLGIAVLLVIGNTIRLEVYNRHEEIEIMKLVGATTAFVRRPFLYTGLWYGLFGGLFAMALILLAIFWLSQPMQQLLSLYNSDLILSYPGLPTWTAIVGGSILLGQCGAWLAVGQHLRKIEPS